MSVCVVVGFQVNTLEQVNVVIRGSGRGSQSHVVGEDVVPTGIMGSGGIEPPTLRKETNRHN